MSMPWDNGRGLLYGFPPFKMVPQVLQKIAQSTGSVVVSGVDGSVPRRSDPAVRRRSRPADQDVLIGDGVTETRRFGPSNLHTWKLYGPS